MSMRLTVLAVLAAGLFIAAPRGASAQAAPTACGKTLSMPVFERWTQLGGADGVLGCPTDDEAGGGRSPQGSDAREADFATGMIVWHASGPRAGQTFAVAGCIWRTYFQFAGPTGWLGLPITGAQNMPDGQRQYFEGGRIVFERASDTCEAEHPEDFAQTAQAAPTPVATSPLDAWLDPAIGDHLSVANAGAARTADAAHYQRLAHIASVFDVQTPGTTPLKLYWNQATGDHVTVATAESERNALATGYEFEASQGFVWTDPHTGAIVLRQFVDPTSSHHWLVASQEEEARASAAGFRFQRIEGYAPPAP